MKKLNILLFSILALAVLAMFFLFKDRITTKSEFSNYPFFLSTKFSISNVRAGPGAEFPIVWIYKQKEIPFKVIASYKDWYQIENYEGGVGWIFKNTTSTIKYAVSKEQVQVYIESNEHSNKLATLDKGLIVKLLKKDNKYAKIYLRLNKEKIVGWVLESSLWGEL